MPEVPAHHPQHAPPARPSAPAAAHIAHAIAGRVRLRLAHSHPALLDRVRRRLAAQPGIHHVDVDPRTGSVLILGAVTAEVLRRIGEEEGLFDLVPSEALRPLEDDMTKVLERVDTAVRDVSGGRIGLMGLVVASLATLAVVQIGRGRFDVPAPTLLWYTLSAVLMLRPRPAT